jgi:peroxiredoxin
MKTYLAIITTFLLITGCSDSRSSEEFIKKLSLHNSPGTEAAPFIGRTTKDTFLPLTDLRGQVVLLTFWRKRCKTCAGYLDGLEKVYQDLKERGFTVLAINGDNLNYVPSSAIKKMISERGYTFPIVFDDEYAILEKYKVIDIPITYLLDKNGIISTVTKGAVNWQSGDKLASIEALL